MVTLLVAENRKSWEPGPVVSSASADVDGDGKEEPVTIAKNGPVWTLVIGKATVTGRAADNMVEGLGVIDVDASDKRKEIAVYTLGEMDEAHVVVLYAFDGKKITELGRVPALSEVRGNGIVLVDGWAGFWNRREKHVLDKSTGRLKHLPQELYWVNAEGTVKSSFPLRRSRADATVIANTAPGSKIVVVAYAPGAKRGDDWYLVRTESGLLGWTRLEALEKSAELPWAG